MNKDSSRSYEITARSSSAGSGWNLKLYQDGVEAGGGAFPLQDEDAQAGIDWWNTLAEAQRSHWLLMAASAIPADARRAYLLSQAYEDAQAHGDSWVGQ